MQAMQLHLSEGGFLNLEKYHYPELLTGAQKTSKRMKFEECWSLPVLVFTGYRPSYLETQGFCTQRQRVVIYSVAFQAKRSEHQSW